MSLFPTENDLVDLTILLNLTDEELSRTCKSNKYLNGLCQKDYLWKLKLEKSHPEFLVLRETFSSYREIYEWAKIGVYVVYYLGRSIVCNDIRDAYKYSATEQVLSTMDFDEEEGEEEIDVPPIERANEIPLSSVNHSNSNFIYALPEKEEIVGADPKHILLKFPDYFDPQMIISPVLASMPTVKPDVFVTYELYLPGNKTESHVAKLTNQTFEDLFTGLQTSGDRSLMNHRFIIQRSDDQAGKEFHYRGNFFLSEGYPFHLVIVKFETGIYLAEFPWDVRGIDHLTPEMINQLKWKPIDSIREYL